jgi:hypothetical protein
VDQPGPYVGISWQTKKDQVMDDQEWDAPLGEIRILLKASYA